MPDFLTDPRFLVPNFLALVAIGVAVYVFRKQRKLKELAFSSAGIPIVEVEFFEGFDRKIKVLYEGEEVENMQHVLVRLHHSGNEPIRPNDYEGPLVVDLGDEARVYQCEVDAKHPKELKVSPTVDGGRVTLGKPLLNPGDRFWLGVLATNPNDPVDVHARIAGLTRVRIDRSDDNLRVPLRYLTIVSVLLGASFAYIASVLYGLNDAKILTDSSTVLATVALLTVYSTLLAFIGGIFIHLVRSE